MLDISPNLATGVGVSEVCGDSDPCAVFQLNHLEPAFFPHPCAETPTRAETPTLAETRILTVICTACVSLVLLVRVGCFAVSYTHLTLPTILRV